MPGTPECSSRGLLNKKKKKGEMKRGNEVKERPVHYTKKHITNVAFINMPVPYQHIINPEAQRLQLWITLDIG